MLILFIFIVLTILFLLRISKTDGKSSLKLPPGPKPWPIIGNIHQLGKLPHVSLAKLSQKYGSLMSLKLGSVTTIVVSSSTVAKEVFTKHDLAFSARIITHATTAANHDKFSMAWLPVCPKWRQLKKLATLQLFTSYRLDQSQFARQRKVNDMVEYIQKCCENGIAIDIGKVVFITTLNLLSNTFFSVDLASLDSSNSHEFKEVATRLLEDVAKPNVSDFFPLISHLDLQGVKKRMEVNLYRMTGFFREIIGDRLRNAKNTEDDVLGYLLKLVKENELSLEDVEHMLVDLFVAGNESTSNTLQWAMTEVLRHPKIMVKAQEELDQVIGKNERVKESDISKLPYIEAIVKETFRLHPPSAFLIPRKSEVDVELCGYYVPKNAQILINTWSIGRDPSVWPNPLSFTPERFIQSNIEAKGRHFELIPFGAGRRICPAISLSHTMLHLMLATLLHTFNWKNGDEENREIDVVEKFGLSLQKARPLLAIPLPRSVV